MLSVVPILERIEPIAPDASLTEIRQRFCQAPGLIGLPVMEGSKLIGVIGRDQLGDLLLKDPSEGTAADLAERECPTLESGIDIASLDSSLLIDQVTRYPRIFIITRQGHYEGLCSGLDMLQAIQADLVSKVRQQAEELARLRQPQATVQPPLDAAHHGMVSHALIQVLNDRVLPQLGRLRDSHGDMQRRMARHPLAVSLERMRHQVRELEHRAMAMLDLSRLASGNHPQDVADVGLRHLMDQLQGDWEPRFAATGSALSVSYDGVTDLVAHTDGQALRRVFDCLLARTLDQGGDGVVEAALKARVIDGKVQLVGSVRDEGCAQPPEVLADFSNPDAPLTDLDQALSRKLVQRLHGTIRAENNAGLGSSVIFEVTTALAKACEGKGDCHEDKGSARVEPVGRILIVDDNATNRIVAQALCEMFGFETEMVEDGQEAVDIVAIESFDAILMDIKMPRMDGLTATQIILGMEGPAAQTPIVALTANADPDDKARYLAAGMRGVVEKPIKPEQLMHALNAALSAEPSSPEEAAVAVGAARA